MSWHTGISDRDRTADALLQVLSSKVLIAAIRVAATGKFHGRKMPLESSIFITVYSLLGLASNRKTAVVALFREMPDFPFVPSLSKHERPSPLDRLSASGGHVQGSIVSYQI